MISQAIQALNIDQIQTLMSESSNDALSQSVHLYSQIINVFPTDEYGLRIFQPTTTYNSRPNKTQQAQARLPSIPPKQPTKAQQHKRTKLGRKTRCKIRSCLCQFTWFGTNMNKETDTTQTKQTWWTNKRPSKQTI